MKRLTKGFMNISFRIVRLKSHKNALPLTCAYRQRKKERILSKNAAPGHYCYILFSPVYANTKAPAFTSSPLYSPAETDLARRQSFPCQPSPSVRSVQPFFFATTTPIALLLKLPTEVSGASSTSQNCVLSKPITDKSPGMDTWYFWASL